MKVFLYTTIFSDMSIILPFSLHFHNIHYFFRHFSTPYLLLSCSAPLPILPSLVHRIIHPIRIITVAVISVIIIIAVHVDIVISVIIRIIGAFSEAVLLCVATITTIRTFRITRRRTVRRLAMIGRTSV